MNCEHEEHLVELADKLVKHYHDRMEEDDQHMQELLEAIPDACQHVGVPRLNLWFPSETRRIVRLPIRKGPKRELDRACFDAIQAFRRFRMIDRHHNVRLWLKAIDMRDRFRERLEQCEHDDKGA